jgi:type I restriction enzyme R subunit
MATFSESSTIQAALLARLSDPGIGWTPVAAQDLARGETQALVESEVVEALLRLNPKIAAKPERVDEILPRLRATVLAVADEGLVRANELMISWLRGLVTHQFIGEPKPEPIRLIDFDDLANNRFVISTEVVYEAGSERRRYDVVLWANGFPLVVGETKTPVKALKSWLNGARDINAVYERKTPGFFVSNVLSFATEGKDFRYGPIGLPAEMWLPWSRTDEEILPLGMKRALRSAELLLTPEMVLEMLRTYTLYSTVRIGRAARAIKIIARYPQVEAVEALVVRAKDSTKRQGLIWHHQGSGKTFLMAFACGKLRREVPGATVVVVLDRLDLIEQTTREFESVGVRRIRAAETKEQLRTMLSGDQRGVVITTIFRFKDAEKLTDREDVVVLVDEAHRTQEGGLGADMRRALPMATYIGMTGTPISDGDRDTYENFGDPEDPGYVINAYSSDRSMADGATLPLRVEAPRVDLQFDKEALDEAFDEMAAEEGLTEAEKEQLARKASKAKTFLKTDERIASVCADIVDHWYARMRPLGLKAQVVAFDRELCVLYQGEIQRLLDKRGDGVESTVVMTTNDKEDPEAWLAYDRDRAEEAKVKARFRDAEDQLCFLVVTAKLLTGFDAPIEGVMYLDKPLKRHTLFQALTRTNRRYTNPAGQEKTHGLIVDYVGLGKEIAEAMRIEKRPGEPDPLDVETLKQELKAALAACLGRFDGIDLSDAGFEALMDAQERIADPADRDAFAREYLTVQALFELLWPDEDLRPIRDQYRWAAKLYQSVQPAMTPDALLWQRLGAKTLAIVNEHVLSVNVREDGVEHLTIDEETLDALRKLGAGDIEDGGDGRPGGDPKTAEEILDSIQARVELRLGEKGDPRYTSLAERLDRLRQMQVVVAADSIEFLKRILEVARDLVAVDRETAAEEAAETGQTVEEVMDADGLLPEERRGALTQIFEEHKPGVAPEILQRVVAEIDAVVIGARFTRWQTSREGVRTVKTEIRKALKKFGLPATGELFERAYDYVAENY